MADYQTIIDELQKNYQKTQANNKTLSQRFEELDAVAQGRSMGKIMQPQIGTENPLSSATALGNLIYGRAGAVQDMTSRESMAKGYLSDLLSAISQQDESKLAWNKSSQGDPDALAKEQADRELDMEILDTAYSLKGTGKTSAISGFKNIGLVIPGSKSQDAKTYADQLDGLVALKKRQLLKGSGSVSDAEQRMLTEASSALKRKLSDKEYKKRLDDMIGFYEDKLSGKDVDEIYANKWTKPTENKIDSSSKKKDPLGILD